MASSSSLEISLLPLTRHLTGQEPPHNSEFEAPDSLDVPVFSRLKTGQDPHGLESLTTTSISQGDSDELFPPAPFLGRQVTVTSPEDSQITDELPAFPTPFLGRQVTVGSSVDDTSSAADSDELPSLTSSMIQVTEVPDRIREATEEVSSLLTPFFPSPLFGRQATVAPPETEGEGEDQGKVAPVEADSDELPPSVGLVPAFARQITITPPEDGPKQEVSIANPLESCELPPLAGGNPLFARQATVGSPEDDLKPRDMDEIPYPAESDDLPPMFGGGPLFGRQATMGSPQDNPSPKHSVVEGSQSDLPPLFGGPLFARQATMASPLEEDLSADQLLPPGFTPAFGRQSTLGPVESE